MTLAVTHTHVSAIADDGSDVGSNAWNAAHTLTGTVSIAQGGTNATTFTTNTVNYYDGASVASMAGTTWNSTNQRLTLTGDSGGTAYAPQIGAIFEVQANATNWEGQGQIAYGNNTFALGFDFYKTRGTDPTVNVALVDGDGIGYIQARGANGAGAYDTTARINFEVEGTGVAGRVPGRIRFLTRPAAAPFVERMRIDSNGNVVVGASLDVGITRSAANVLEVNNGTIGTLAAIKASNFIGLVENLEFVIDGGGSTIITGMKGYLYVDNACTINQATLLADQSGSIVVDIFACSYANFDAGATHPVSGDKITASAPPTITTATKAQDSTLTGWTTTIAAGTVLAFNVSSVTTIARVTLALKVTRT